MPTPGRRARLAVLSPFIDKRHGTERCVAEQIERLADAYEIHLYSSRVEDIDLRGITWHRVAALGGPHLFSYIWWLFANRFQRWRDAKFRGIAPDVVYSPGVNCLDADVVSVHVLFSKVREQMFREQAALKQNANAQPGTGRTSGRNRVGSWALMLHRRIYYRLLESLENKVYGPDGIYLAAVSEKGAHDIRARFGPKKHLSAIYYGIDSEKFNPQSRMNLRAKARAELKLSANDFAVLFVGNDWRNRGLPCLLKAVGMLEKQTVHVLVVGSDSTIGYRETVDLLGLTGRVHFLPPRRDIEFYYAAADAYAGPSLEDTFSLPPAEAMSCGLPAITTRAMGVSEIIHHGEDGLILEDPNDAKTLSEWIARLADDCNWRDELGTAAAHTTKNYTWARNSERLQEIIEDAIKSKTRT
jgi:glycosyltransferase involved in cell wall biosynthesis